MRKKNLLLLTSITGLLLTLTPVQALAQETSTSPTSTSQSSDDKEFENEKDKRLPTDEKCHWKGETPVPENKYLKLLYDSLYKDYEDDLEKIKNGDYYYRVKNLLKKGRCLKMKHNTEHYYI